MKLVQTNALIMKKNFIIRKRNKRKIKTINNDYLKQTQDVNKNYWMKSKSLMMLTIMLLKVVLKVSKVTLVYLMKLK